MHIVHTSAFTSETNPKLVKPEGVDEEDDVEDEVAKDGHDHQWFPKSLMVTSLYQFLSS